MQEIQDFKSKTQEIISRLQEEFSSLRADQANPGLVENILVEYYGTPTPLKQVGSIGIADARTLVISPWSRDTIPDIEKAINKHGNGLTAQSDSEVVRIKIPSLNNERRQQIIKQINEKAEQARIAVRRLRDQIREQIKDINIEDDKFKGLKDLDVASEDVNQEIEKVRENKEKQIME
ncbi:ribosome recycling factor [bacterium]|nr:ribosome recycling factor [bacterium]|tara:strand:+ start:543 stop:1076 length:534 start_codon:yes stop_codon:yes gene_type:complete